MHNRTLNCFLKVADSSHGQYTLLKSFSIISISSLFISTSCRIRNFPSLSGISTVKNYNDIICLLFQLLCSYGTHHSQCHVYSQYVCTVHITCTCYHLQIHWFVRVYSKVTGKCFIFLFVFKCT